MFFWYLIEYVGPLTVFLVCIVIPIIVFQLRSDPVKRLWLCQVPGVSIAWYVLLWNYLRGPKVRPDFYHTATYASVFALMLFVTLLCWYMLLIFLAALFPEQIPPRPDSTTEEEEEQAA
ncbi:MAG: hypothetical protein CMJ46_13500 [Planctomyces sp.]|nr:hypothetical protein [Planctomyces sp.]